MEARTTLTDKQWALIDPVLPGRTGDPGRSGNNNRMSLEGMIWITRTGAPWRDLPKEFGNWNTVHRRFRRWAQSGVFQRIFEVVEEDLDLKTVMVDGTFAKVHQHGAGAKKSGCPPEESAERQAIGRSRGGLTTKLMAVVDKAGRLVRFTIRPGNAAEAPELTTLLDGVLTGELIADKAYDSDPIRLALASGGIVATIPPRGQPPGPVLVRPAAIPDAAPGRELLLRQSKQFSGRRHHVQQAGRQLLRHGQPGLLDHRYQEYPGELRKSRSINQATNSPRITPNYPLALAMVA